LANYSRWLFSAREVPTPFTARGSYPIELNLNGKREWTMEIYAGDIAYRPSKYSDLLLKSAAHLLVLGERRYLDKHPTSEYYQHVMLE
jgi:hypothetical protein